VGLEDAVAICVFVCVCMCVCVCVCVYTDSAGAGGEPGTVLGHCTARQDLHPDFLHRPHAPGDLDAKP
jgi:hypothetical protein